MQSLMGSRTAFVAAPYSDVFSLRLESDVNDACRLAGLIVVRQHRLLDGTRAFRQIEHEVRCSSVVIGVVTNRNAHVFLELGIACSLGKPILALGRCQEDFGILEDNCRCAIYDEGSPGNGTRLAADLMALLRDRHPVLLAPFV